MGFGGVDARRASVKEQERDHTMFDAEVVDTQEDAFVADEEKNEPTSPAEWLEWAWLHA